MKTVILVVVVIIVLAVVAGMLLRSRRKAALRDRFGPEYDRAVEREGTERHARRHLSDVAERRDQLEIRELEPRERAAYQERWDAVQVRFVDDPGGAVDDAGRLVSDVMRHRGYPVDNFDERADMVSVDHPEVVEHYRAAHAAHRLHLDRGAAGTEDLRQAFTHYRALFERLIGAGVGHAAAAGSAPVGRHADVDLRDEGARQDSNPRPAD